MSLYSWDGYSKTILPNADAVGVAMSKGLMIQDDSGFTYDNAINKGSVISVAGGFLLKGCPIDTYFGSTLTTDEAKVLVGIAPTLTQYGYTTCLTQAQALLGSGGNVAPTPKPIVSDTGGGGGGAVAVTINTAPSIPGAQPQGGGPSYNNNVICNGPGQIFRFILAVPSGFATGANRQGCSPTNSANCDPQLFGTLGDAIQYALNRGEIPYKVVSDSEPWDIIACKVQIDPNRIYNPDGSLGSGGSWVLYLIAAVVGYKLLK